MNSSQQSTNTKDDKKSIEHCTAFCPKCGSDLYYLDNECICKNKKCNWSCGGCSKMK